MSVSKYYQRGDNFMYTERRAIEDRIRDIRDERRRLSDEYYSLLQRLREIDQRDMNESNLDITERLTTTVEKLSEVIPHIPAEAMVQHVAKNFSPEMVATEEVKETVTENVEKAVQEKKVQAPKVVPVSPERMASVIKTVIEKHEGPMKAKDIEKRVQEETGKKFANFSEQLRKAREKFPSIEKVGFGKYQINQMDTAQLQIAAGSH
jgi:predicted nucleic-acid-binding protein